MSFIHLRTQSSYSMLQSSIKVDQIVELSKKYSMPAVALTDHNNLFASLEFSLYAQKKGVQPICGVLFDSDHGQLVVLARNKIGYQNLFYLNSIQYVKNPLPPSITYPQLFEAQEGLIILSGYNFGNIGKLLLAEKKEHAYDLAQKFKKDFGDSFYMEVMRHGYNEEFIEKDYLEIASLLEIPVVATNRVLFGEKENKKSYDILRKISKTHEQEEVAECYFKSSEEMQKLFIDIPSAIENTIEIALRCNFFLKSTDPIFPVFDSGALTQEELLIKKAREGLENRLEQKVEYEKSVLGHNIDITKISDLYFKQLEFELGIICKMKFAGYFLIVSDFICWSKENKIPVGPGRGSGAGSIVAWSLFITDLDPLKFGLLFERFLNPDRISLPDFDIDFCQEKRDLVIDYVKKKYGEGRVAQIITFGKLQAKAVIKDVARVMAVPYSIADKVAELIPFNAVNPVTLNDALEEVEELKNIFEGKGLYSLQLEEDMKQRLQQVLQNALELEGVHRHVSVHAAGIVIAANDLIKIVPLYAERSHNLIIQYSMKYAELAGLIKFDFLGLKTLTVIGNTIDSIKDIKIDLNFIPLDDSKTYEMLSSGNSTGVFQFENAGAKDALRRLKPDCIEDIIALTSLNRPGPMENIPTYVACKHGKQNPNYLHPSLEETLKETYGVIIYQEQVMKIAQVLAGYSLGEADILRRAMGKKIKSEMEAQENQFIKGALKNNVSDKDAKNIFAYVAKFAGYGFNKSHAAAYAMITYQTAYLKANYTTEFLIASINLDLNISNKVNLFIQEAKKFGITILPPDINKSEVFFKNENGKIRYGFAGIKGIGEEFSKIISQKRDKGFTDIFDFVSRISLSKREFEHLIKSGCFDSIYENRAALLNAQDLIMDYGRSKMLEKSKEQKSFFDTSSIIQIPKVPFFSNDEKSKEEYEAFGFYLTSHPLDDYMNIISAQNFTQAVDLEDLEIGSHRVTMIGVIQKKDTKMSPRGRFTVLTLSDPTGIYEATIFSDEIFKNAAALLVVKQAVILNTEIRKDEGGIRIYVLEVKTIESLQKQNEIYFDENQDITKLISSSDTTQIYWPIEEEFFLKIQVSKV